MVKHEMTFINQYKPCDSAMNSAYSIFKRPDLIAKGEPFLEVYLGRFQAQVDYTPNLAQEINLSRIQRCLPRLNRITLSRHGGSVHKYAPVVQATEQKSGIGIAAVSPVERNNTTVFRPDRTGLRKTPSSWLPANVIRKDHPGFVLIGLKVKEGPFLSRGL